MGNFAVSLEENSQSETTSKWITTKRGAHNKLDHLFSILLQSCGVVSMITIQPELKWNRSAVVTHRWLPLVYLHTETNSTFSYFYFLCLTKVCNIENHRSSTHNSNLHTLIYISCFVLEAVANISTVTAGQVCFFIISVITGLLTHCSVCGVFSSNILFHAPASFHQFHQQKQDIERK